MSSGRSSQLSACFSVDRTKYLMLSKSISDRSAPQVGSGLRPNMRSPRSRRSSIHWGSLFRAEMSRTTSSDRPRRADAPATSLSAQPNLYAPSPSSWSLATVVILRALRTLKCFAVSLGLNRAWVVLLPCQGSAGHVGGADTVAVRDGRQPPHRDTQQAAERLGLGLAQLREL